MSPCFAVAASLSCSHSITAAFRSCSLSGAKPAVPRGSPAARTAKKQAAAALRTAAAILARPFSRLDGLIERSNTALPTQWTVTGRAGGSPTTPPALLSPPCASRQAAGQRIAPSSAPLLPILDGNLKAAHPTRTAANDSKSTNRRKADDFRCRTVPHPGVARSTNGGKRFFKSKADEFRCSTVLWPGPPQKTARGPHKRAARRSVVNA